MPFGGTLRQAQYFGDWAGEIVFWEWYCGDWQVCFDVLVYDNEYGEEIGFSIEWTPFSETDGDATWSDVYYYDYGSSLDDYGGDEEDPPVLAGFSGRTRSQLPPIVRVQSGLGACYIGRLNCLATSLQYNFKTAFKWSFGFSFISCLPAFGTPWSTYGYVACLPWSTGIGVAQGFVQHVLDKAGQCFWTCA